MSLWKGMQWHEINVTKLEEHKSSCIEYIFLEILTKERGGNKQPWTEPSKPTMPLSLKLHHAFCGVLVSHSHYQFQTQVVEFT